MAEKVLADARLLYVEDDELVRRMLAQTLRRRVKELYEAGNGLEGLEIYKKLRDEIDVIVTDIEMPLMNGLVMIEEIRKISPHVPIIVVTAYNDEYHRTKLADAFVVKPVKKDDLFRVITECLQKRYS
ncbi:MAG: response regulator [Campylobacterales bacterium]